VPGLCAVGRSYFVSAEFYRDDDVDVPDKLKLNFTLDDKPIAMSLVRSDSVPPNPPVIISHNNRRTYWSRQPASVNASLPFSTITAIFYLMAHIV